MKEAKEVRAVVVDRVPARGAARAGTAEQAFATSMEALLVAVAVVPVASISNHFLRGADWVWTILESRGMAPNQAKMTQPDKKSRSSSLTPYGHEVRQPKRSLATYSDPRPAVQWHSQATACCHELCNLESRAPSQAGAPAHVTVV